MNHMRFLESLIPAWARHNGFRIAMAAYVVALFRAAVEVFVVLPGDLAFVLTLAWVTVQYYAFLAVFLHAHGPLCERCIGDMPLDGSAKAEKYKRNLATVHLFADRRRLTIVAWLGFYGLVYAARKAGLYSSSVETLLSSLPVMWLLLSMSRHARVEPWCPKCQSGGRRRKPTREPQPGPVLALSR